MIWVNEAKDKYVTKCDIIVAGTLIPEGFEFDGMSAPWLLRSFVGGPYRPKTVEAVLLHDFMYQKKQRTRLEADKLFLKLLRNDKVKCAYLFFLGVRAFGWLHYRKPKS